MMIIDAHVHLGPTLKQHSESMVPLYEIHTGEQLVRLMDAAGIGRAVVFAPRWVGGEIIDPNYEMANRAIFEAITQHPTRLIGFGRVNPNFGRQAIQEIRKCLDDYGLRGIKLHPAWDSFHPNSRALVHPLMELAKKRRVPVLFHSGHFPAEPGQFLELAETFPEVPIILGHMGQRLLADALIVAERAANVYLETSEASDSYISTAARRVGPERLLFGTNAPFQVPAADIEKIRLIPTLTEEQKAKILGGNAATLFDLT